MDAAAGDALSGAFARQQLRVTGLSRDGGMALPGIGIPSLCKKAQKTTLLLREFLVFEEI